jgi:CRISPR-associated endonuclease/helicase Cas3
MQSGITSAIEAYRACGLSYSPNPMQEEMFTAILSGDCTVLLKAPTGSGKTETITVPALQADRRLFLIFPALSLIEDQEIRIARILQHRSLMVPERPHALVVDTGAAMYRRVWKGGQEQSRRQRRHLYYGDVILTTLDKFLYRFFGFGESKKSYTYPLRLRYGRSPLFCFDEVHSYETVSYTNFVDLIRAIGYNSDAPRDVVVMTATMPASYEQDLLPLLTPIDYLSGEQAERLVDYYAAMAPRPFPHKELVYLPASLSKREAINQMILGLVEQYHQPGLRTIITVETVALAVMLYRALAQQQEATLSEEMIVLYHGRQPHPLRRRMYRLLREQEETNQGYVLVTTSAIEVGCDLNAHLLITQLCDPESLVQRAGRTNRRGDLPDARVIVVGDRPPAYSSTLADEQELEHYLMILRSQAEQRRFDPMSLIGFRRKDQVADYRVRTMFGMLYDYVYLAERANQPLHEKGLVITRSWDPVVTLATGWDEHWVLENPLQVSMLECSTYQVEQLDPACQILVRSYDEASECYTCEPPKVGGCAYYQELIIRVPPSFVDPVVGYVDLPKVFIRAGGRSGGYRHWLHATISRQDVQPETNLSEKKQRPAKTQKQQGTPGTEIWWWYLGPLPIGSPKQAELLGHEDESTSNSGVRDQEELTDDTDER